MGVGGGGVEIVKNGRADRCRGGGGERGRMIGKWLVASG